MTSLADALLVRSSDQVRADLFASLLAKGIDATGFPGLSFHRALLEVDVNAKAKLEQLKADLTNAGFITTAALAGDDWLDRAAYGFNRVRRMPATRAVWTVTLRNNGSGGPFPLNAGAVRLALASSSSTTFTSIENRTLASVPGSTVDVQFACDVAGDGGNIAPNVLVTSLAGVTIAGAVLVAAGANQESSPALVTRCLAQWGAGSAGGNADAFAQWIAGAFLEQGLTSSITKYRIDDTNPLGPGSVALYLANDAGPATAGELAIVNPYVQKRRTLGTGTWGVFAAAALTLTIGGTLYVSGNVNALADALASLVALASTTPLGGKLYKAEVIAALMSVGGAYNVSLPALADVTTLDASQVLTLASSLVLG